STAYVAFSLTFSSVRVASGDTSYSARARRATWSSRAAKPSADRSWVLTGPRSLLPALHLPEHARDLVACAEDIGGAPAHVDPSRGADHRNVHQNEVRSHLLGRVRGDGREERRRHLVDQ